MIADIEHRGLKLDRIGLEQGDDPAQKIVRVEYGIVIGIAYFRHGAFIELIATADWCKFFKRERIPLEICRAVIALLLQDNHDITVGLSVDVFLQA